MKAVVNNDVLLKELKRAGMCVKKNVVYPILSNVKFDFKKDSLMITTNDLETMFISTIPCECKEPFSVLIQHLDIIDICNTAVAPIKIELKESLMVITSGAAKHKLSLSGEPVNFPKVEGDDYLVSFQADGDFFFNLGNANTCKPKESVHPNFDNAAIDVKKKKITVVGTDGHLIYKKEFKNESKIEKTVMVCDMFVNICKNFQGSVISIGDRFIKVESGNEIVISRLSEQKFCNYNAVLPETIEYNLKINKNEFRNALKSINVSTDLLTKSCVFIFSKDKIKLVSQNPDLIKESENELDIKHDVPIPTICFNASLLLHLLNIVEGEELEVSITAENRAIFIKPQDDNSLLLMLQPIYNKN